MCLYKRQRACIVQPMLKRHYIRISISALAEKSKNWQPRHILLVSRVIISSWRYCTHREHICSRRVIGISGPVRFAQSPAGSTNIILYGCCCPATECFRRPVYCSLHTWEMDVRGLVYGDDPEWIMMTMTLYIRYKSMRVCMWYVLYVHVYYIHRTSARFLGFRRVDILVNYSFFCLLDDFFLPFSIFFGI